MGGRIATELIGDESPWLRALAVQQLPKNPSAARLSDVFIGVHALSLLYRYKNRHQDGPRSLRWILGDVED